MFPEDPNAPKSGLQAHRQQTAAEHNLIIEMNEFITWWENSRAAEIFATDTREMMQDYTSRGVGSWDLKGLNSQTWISE